MPRRCAFGCKPNGDPIHRFPDAKKLPDLFKTWVSLVGGKLETPSDYENYMTKQRVCHRHFLTSHMNRNNRLSAIAVPTLHLPVKEELMDEHRQATGIRNNFRSTGK